MLERNTRRAALFALLALMTSACAHGASSGSEFANAWGTTTGPMCEVRLESAYATPVEAGASAGAKHIELGVVDPHETRDFVVPCAHRAVTVFRVLRAGGKPVNRIDSQARALDTGRVTVVTLRPS